MWFRGFRPFPGVLDCRFGQIEMKVVIRFAVGGLRSEFEEMLSQRAERSAQEIRRLGDTSLFEAGFTKSFLQALRLHHR